MPRVGSERLANHQATLLPTMHYWIKAVDTDFKCDVTTLLQVHEVELIISVISDVVMIGMEEKKKVRPLSNMAHHVNQYTNYSPSPDISA